jgi:hypothetical protein
MCLPVGRLPFGRLATVTDNHHSGIASEARATGSAHGHVPAEQHLAARAVELAGRPGPQRAAVVQEQLSGQRHDPDPGPVGVAPIMAVTTVAALDEVPEDLRLCARTLGVVPLHHAAGADTGRAAGILTGMRISMTGAWTSIVAAELIAATSGLVGHYPSAVLCRRAGGRSLL